MVDLSELSRSVLLSVSVLGSKVKLRNRLHSFNNRCSDSSTTISAALSTSFQVKSSDGFLFLNFSLKFSLSSDLVKLSFLEFLAFLAFGFELLDFLEFLVDISDLLFQVKDEEVLVSFSQGIEQVLLLLRLGHNGMWIYLFWFCFSSSSSLNA